MKLIVGLFSIVLGSASIAQVDSMAIHENELEVLLNDLRAAENNSQKAERNDIFKAKLERVLQNEASLTYSFSKLSTVGFIDSPDKIVRVINWNVEQDDLSQRYYGFVIRKDKRRKKYYVTELKEDQFGISQPTEVVTSGNWYGALYYKIIPVKKGSRVIYTLLGWDGNTSLSNIKLVDAMYFTGKEVKFGTPIFRINKELKNRLFYEHSEKTTMVLRYEEDRKRIMMDHLAPEAPSLKGFRSFYVPDLSYDALKFEKGKWVLHEDVIGVNDELDSDKQVIYTKDPKTGKLKKVVVKNDWKDPTDYQAPVGSSEHVAVTPESQAQDNEKKKDQNANLPEVDKKDKRDPSQLSIYEGLKKKKRRKKKKRN